MSPQADPSSTVETLSAADIRAWIVGELARSLRVDPRSIDTAGPLVSIGADSLTALTVTAGLAEWMNRDLDATLMWDYGSIDAIAEALADADASTTALPGIVVLQSHGDGRPLFCFPGAGGHPVTFGPITAHLGLRYRCYGLTVPGLHGERPPLEEVEEIAEAMLENIRRVQAKGPYQFAGYSFGGLLAYEAAQQLRAVNETVSMLAIFDTFTPDAYVLRPRWQRLALHAYILATRPGRREYVQAKLKTRQQAREISAALKGSASTEIEVRNKLALEVQAACGRAAERYQPRPYPGSVLLFRASEPDMENIFFRTDKESNGWGALTRVRVIDLPGSHHTILDPETASAAAEMLRPYLA